MLMVPGLFIQTQTKRGLITWHVQMSLNLGLHLHTEESCLLLYRYAHNKMTFVLFFSEYSNKWYSSRYQCSRTRQTIIKVIVYQGLLLLHSTFNNTTVLLKDEVLITVGCPIFPPFYIDSQISVHRKFKKNRSIDI